MKQLSIFDTSKNQFVTYLDPGCGPLYLISDNITIFSTTIESGAIPNVPILDDDKGILTIQGNASHSSVTFSVEEFLTPNNWTIEVSICGSFYKSYSYPYGLPVLTKMEGAFKTKTNIDKKKTATLEEPGFFIENNNTIFIFLPNNTQPGFMNLVVGDGGREIFTSP
ncbi:hypothetical protein ACTFIT_011079 [Dictyostelium discoideum]